jgi:hypothetical protein
MGCWNAWNRCGLLAGRSIGQFQSNLRTLLQSGSVAPDTAILMYAFVVLVFARQSPNGNCRGVALEVIDAIDLKRVVVWSSCRLAGSSGRSICIPRGKRSLALRSPMCDCDVVLIENRQEHDAVLYDHIAKKSRIRRCGSQRMYALIANELVNGCGEFPH